MSKFIRASLTQTNCKKWIYFSLEILAEIGFHLNSGLAIRPCGKVLFDGLLIQPIYSHHHACLWKKHKMFPIMEIAWEKVFVPEKKSDGNKRCKAYSRAQYALDVAAACAREKKRETSTARAHTHTNQMYAVVHTMHIFNVEARIWWKRQSKSMSLIQ